MGLGNWLKHTWSAFTSPSTERESSLDAPDFGSMVSARRPDRPQFRSTNEGSIISSIYTRVAIDAASVDIRHVRLDKEGRYKEDMDSGLNECLTVSANLDQEARHFRQDVVLTLLNSGVAAIVAVEKTLDPAVSSNWEYKQLRVGIVKKFYPKKVKVSVYNEETGRREDLILKKEDVAIIENPLYGVMNEPNSTLQRLIRKLNMLDAVDEASASGKLDIIIQLPYVIKSEAKKLQAEQRREEMEFQLKGSKYGIAYADGTEKITQLNRPAENNLLKQIEYLTAMLYGQLGLTEDVMNGTADEATMLNYLNRTIEPIVAAISGEMKRKFLTKTARTQKQSMMYFRDPFKLIPLSAVAEIADKLTRAEAVSSNEIRGWLGMKPRSDPKADELRNSNMPAPSGSAPPETPLQEGDSPNDDNHD